VRWWPWRREPRNLVSISDPILIDWFGLGQNYAGVAVSELSALGVSAMWRAAMLIAGSLAGLPWRTVRDVAGTRTRVTSVFDDPGAAVGLTPYQWKETIVLHQIMGGDAFLKHLRNEAGGLAGLQPIHPGCVQVDWDDERPGGKRYTVTLLGGKREEHDATTLTQVMGPSLDGLRGLSLLQVAKNSLGAAIAADRSSALMFSRGPLVSGVLVPEEDVTGDEARTIREEIDQRTSGWENAASVPVINRKLKFERWGTTLKEAQFLETRQFMIQEIARWTGVPASLLMDPGSVSTWGTGVEIQYRGLGRFTLAPYAHRFEEALSRLLSAPRFLEVDFAGLERGTPTEEIDLLVKQVQAGLLTVDEARAIRNLPPLPKAEEQPEPDEEGDREPVAP